MTKVSDAKLDGLSDKNDGLDVADVIDELLALRRVADAAKVLESTYHNYDGGTWAELRDALQGSGR